jgi:hypothetical protein
MNKICTIYKINNILTSQFYIGSSIEIEKRIKRHFSDLKYGKHHSVKMQRSYDKYGYDNFKVEYLVICPEEYRKKFEQWFLDNNNCYYNIAQIVDKLPSPSNRAWSQKSKDKLSISKMGNKSKMGLKCSEDTKVKMSENSVNKRSILQFSTEGIFVKEWESIKLASKELNFQNTSIVMCCRGRRRQAHKFIWMYKDDIIDSIYNENKFF